MQRYQCIKHNRKAREECSIVMHDGSVVVRDVPRVDPLPAKSEEVSFVTCGWNKLRKQHLIHTVIIIIIIIIIIITITTTTTTTTITIMIIIIIIIIIIINIFSQEAISPSGGFQAGPE